METARQWESEAEPEKSAREKTRLVALLGVARHPKLGLACSGILSRGAAGLQVAGQLPALPTQP